MQGRRREDSVLGTYPDDVQPGDYWKVIERDGEPKMHDSEFNESGHVWQVVTPDGRMGLLTINNVIEHEDGTISVQPTEGFPDNLVTSAGKGGYTGHIDHGEWD